MPLAATCALPLEEPVSDSTGLLSLYSLEMTAKDIPQLGEVAARIPAGTRISVTFLPGESEAARVDAVAAAHGFGFTPVPHLSARRLQSAAELEGYLARIRERAPVDHAFVIAGDLPRPSGPFDDALAIIRSGLLEKHGIRHVGISGYPQGHPDIPDDRLWAAMRDKVAALAERDLEASIVTQFGFDAAPILDWTARVRANGIAAPIWAGVPGPANVRTLLRFASRCGVEASTRVMAKYGLSLTRLLSTAGPDRLVEEIAAGLAPGLHGDVRLHFYPFGGFGNTIRWIDDAGRASRP